MKVLHLDDVLGNAALKNEVVRAIRAGRIFVYPTDTVYGMGCNAEDGKVVAKIREIKRTQHPFSVIAPSKKWIKHRLKVRHAEHLKKLPGPYTLIMDKRRNSFLSSASPGGSLGVRMPEHPFTQIVSAAGVPFVTTSANVSGQPTIKSPKEIPVTLAEGTDFFIDAGTIIGRPSTVIDLTGDVPTVIRK